MIKMITKRKGNGLTECRSCNEKGRFALTWDSWLYNFNDEPWCFNCLMEKLEDLQKQNTELKKENERLKNIETSLIFIKNRVKQGMTQENINKCAINFLNNYLKEVDQ